MTKSRRVIVLSVSSLTPSILGFYGSAFLKIKLCDRIASRSLVCDRFIADSGDSRQVLCSMLTGRHAASLPTNEFSSHLVSQLNALAGETVFISDDPQLAIGAANAGFRQVQILDERPIAMEELIENTRMARLIGLAMQQLRQQPDLQLLWLHLDSLAVCWDAPWEFRGQWADEEGPQPREDNRPPSIHDSEFDPDELLSWIYTYGDQVGLLDVVLERLWQFVASEPESMFILTGTSGMSLGTHQWIGPHVGPLLSPRTQLPMLVYQSQLTSVRSAKLCQPACVAETIGRFLLGDAWQSGNSKNLFELSQPTSWASDQLADELAVTIDGDELAIQTIDWHWYRSAAGDERLFRKPDDRLDFNNIIDRASEVAELFRLNASQVRLAIERGEQPRLEIT